MAWVRATIGPETRRPTSQATPRPAREAIRAAARLIHRLETNRSYPPIGATRATVANAWRGKPHGALPPPGRGRSIDQMGGGAAPLAPLTSVGRRSPEPVSASSAPL